ncbi:DUF1616 domain-containing protein [Chloroflexota bacterium]
MKGRLLPIVLIMAVLAAFGMPVYTLIVPKTEEKFTEFYINNPDGRPTEYTWDTALGAETDELSCASQYRRNSK